MPKHPLTKAALNRALAEIHPDPETARELLAMGIFRLRTRGGHALHDRCVPGHAPQAAPALPKPLEQAAVATTGPGVRGPSRLKAMLAAARAGKPIGSAGEWCTASPRKRPPACC